MGSQWFSTSLNSPPFDLIDKNPIVASSSVKQRVMLIFWLQDLESDNAVTFVSEQDNK